MADHGDKPAHRPTLRGIAIPACDSPTGILFERWRRGEQTAFTNLHARCTPLLTMRIRRNRSWPMLAAHHQVEDVVQETWARATQSAHRIVAEAPGAMGAFLGKVADRVVIDFTRRLTASKRGGGAVQASDPAMLAQQPPQFPTERPTSDARASELLQIAHQLLSEPEFQAWHLCAIQGFTTDEAGMALLRTGSAVRGLMLRARSKLVARFGTSMHKQ